MIELIVSKELLLAVLISILFFAVLKKRDLMVVSPPNEEMKNVDYHFDDDINT